MAEFVALDFETANNRQDSACAIGIARVSQGKIVAEAHRLIRPPTPDFWYTHIHGLTWNDVMDAPDFKDVWQDVKALFDGVEFISAHNAGFDRAVLYACCDAYGVQKPVAPFLCTVTLARRMWQVRPTKLPDVCRYLAIPLNHHQADSDSRACAEIVMAALVDGWRYAG